MEKLHNHNFKYYSTVDTDSSNIAPGLATRPNKVRFNRASGFTLIELMIALALGLVIAAAATMLFLTAQKSYSLQQGTADVQDNANFGLNYIVRDIRLGNLNTVSADINDQVINAGVVFTSSANAFKDTSATPNKIYSNLPESIAVADNLLTTGNTGSSNVNTEKSDQLVIQYMPQYIDDPDDATKLFGGFDCEGNRITVTKVASGTQPRNIIVQRYFLRTDTNTGSNEPHTTLALACDAGYYSDIGSPTEITGYDENSQIIMKRVDYFHVLFGVQDGDHFRYMSPDVYMAKTSALNTPRPRILSIQIGALVRSSQAVGKDSMIKDNQKFQIFDKEVTLKDPASNSSKYVRQVVSQTIALRNAFGGRGEA